MAYWYWYRQGDFRAHGNWVVSGPHDTYDAAMMARQGDKRDGNVGVPFFADTKEDAEQRTSFQ